MYIIFFGEGEYIWEGDDVMIVVVGGDIMCVFIVVDIFEKEGIICDVVDLWIILLLDEEIILELVENIGWLVVVDESLFWCSFVSDVFFIVVEKGFLFLKVFIKKVMCLYIFVFFVLMLEDVFLLNLDWIV